MLKVTYKIVRDTENLMWTAIESGAEYGPVFNAFDSVISRYDEAWSKYYTGRIKERPPEIPKIQLGVLLDARIEALEFLTALAESRKAEAFYLDCEDIEIRLMSR
jgi:hypothetical protein